MKNYRNFLRWEDLLQYIKTGGLLFYHAPMDRFPVEIKILKTFKNGKLKIRPFNWYGIGGFTIDKGHLSRICIPK